MNSLADAISFAATPVIFAFFIGLSDFYSILILIIFASASILRLARFNLAKMESYFDIGLPTTVNGIGIPALYFLVGFSGISWMAAKWLYLLYFMLSSILMVSSFRAKHFKVFGED
jgi:phosphatidylserine synthase